jgi:21S rRNA (GM2251-2'-O)-methyltransferase
LSPVALKASAGASESLPLLTVNQPGQFLDKCQNNDWKIYAAVTPSPGKSPRTGHYFTPSTLGCPVQKHPCILVLGGEGEGLRWNIQSKADFSVGIEGRRLGQNQVDSLNVSVAAGLLCEAFLRKPSVSKNGSKTGDSDPKVVENRIF